MLGCLRAMWLAARRFEASGDTAMVVLAQAILVGLIGMLAASVFISDGNDQRLWLLFALGPALLAAARAPAAAARPRIAALRTASAAKG